MELVDRDVLLAEIEQCFVDIRSAKGWGMAEVADFLEVHYDSLSKLRSGKVQKPSLDMVMGLFFLAQRSVDRLYNIKARSTGNAELEQRVLALETQVRGVLVMLGGGAMLPGVTVPAGEVADPAALRAIQGIHEATKAGVTKATTEGRGRGHALRARTEEREKAKTARPKKSDAA